MDRKFRGADGLYHPINGCPVTRLPDLQDWFALLYRAIASADGEVYPNFYSLYLYNYEVKALCNEILACCGIKPAWVNIEQVHALVMEQEGGKPGLLLEVNHLVSSDRPTEKSIPAEKYKAESVTLLVHLGLAQDLEQAWRIADSMSADELQDYLTARLYQLHPDLKEKEEREKENKAAMETVMKEMMSGNIQL